MDTNSSDFAGTPNLPIQQPASAGPSLRIVYPNSTNYLPGSLTNDSALALTAFYRGVAFICDTLSTLPTSVYQSKGELRKKIEHPRNRIIARKANPDTLSVHFKRTLFHHAVVWGNGYAIIERDRPVSGTPLAVYNVCPDYVTPFRILEGEYKGKWYYVRALTAENSRVIPAADMLHVHGMGYDGLCGYSTVDTFCEALDLARNGQRFSNRYFTKGTQIQGAIEMPAGATKAQVDEAVNAIKTLHSGMGSDYGLMMLLGGHLTNVTIPPQQSQMIETMQFSQVQISQMLAVSPRHLYDYGRATWGNGEQMDLDDLKYTFLPWVTTAEAELTDKLLTEAEQDRGLYVRFNLDGLLRGDAKTRNDIINSQLNAGRITVNEARALDDREPDPDPASDKLRIPVNVAQQPAPEAEKAPAPTPPTPPQNHSTDNGSALAALMPVIYEACDRVNTKTEKAFANHDFKDHEMDKVVWVNLFSEQQSKFVRQQLATVMETASALSGVDIDVGKLADKYAARVRKMGTTGERPDLKEMVGDALKGESNESDFA